MDVSFPHLGIYIKHLVNHIDIFGFRIAFYGIIIALGMLAGINMACADAKRRGQNPEVYLDFAMYAIIFSIIGARTYYVIFEWDMYKDDLLQIFNLRAGGLAIYGGVIAAVITLIVFTKVKKQSFFSMADSGVLGLILGQIIGRWGNFFNAEAFGGYTDSLFALRYRLDIVGTGMLNNDVLSHVMETDGVKYIQVHPTFLYESCWNLALLIFMLWYRKRKKFDGEVFFIYLGGYGLGRMIIEGLRTDSLLLPHTNIAVSQLLAGICFVVSIICVIIGRKRVKNATE
ncbi:prolipoprotein diacylglyceryl transferase [Lachnoanaerobaculum saburreum F0468]|uniref:Phosphatidylglycerol--prolipoprotein diacylglyceryl transferase n=1 Tax=Lachnoanaerobaculum saburreum F0468 TaxID=1095750 RepID=I0R8T5_9FIRM|nr:prolipoprotein diacylglyceryl transferase [Lachnoanaerobaculum saburreum]EIC96093.1 prolipoprotein diacylglyceryl transferase [Lachnoanaerobaculum saburreum F0468]